MNIKNVSIDKLLVNRTNDRHGELVDEDAAIAWLLKNKRVHMMNLGKDIVNSGEIYETPLVAEQNGNFVVYDGNRRTATLKLIKSPQLSPTKKWAAFYSKLKSEWPGKFPSSIPCQVEDDLERIDEILYRRHTGQQNGIGQSRWENDAKTNFQRRTGKNTKVNVAEEIEALLRSEGRLAESDKMPRSNMNRLMSAEQFRNRAGIAVENQSLFLTHDRDTVLNTLTKIVKDMEAGKLTLDKVWDNKSKKAYLDKIDKAGHLPTAEDLLTENIDAKASTSKVNKKTKTNEKNKSQSSASERLGLIRYIDFEIRETEKNRKILDILRELQFKLVFGSHDNSISVLFRVLLELSINLYIEKNKVQKAGKNQSLADRFSTVLKHMMSRNLIDKKYHDTLEKFDRGEVLLSANTLNAYIHSADFFPSDHHLKGMWDTLQRYILICIKDRA